MDGGWRTLTRDENESGGDDQEEKDEMKCERDLMGEGEEKG